MQGSDAPDGKRARRIGLAARRGRGWRGRSGRHPLQRVEAEILGGDWSPETGADLPHAVGFGLLSMDPGRLYLFFSRPAAAGAAPPRGWRIRRTELGPPRTDEVRSPSPFRATAPDPHEPRCAPAPLW